MRRFIIKTFPKLGLQILFFKTYKKFYNIKKPSGFYEKLIWLNFYENNQTKTLCADKYLVREYLKKLGLERYLNELYGVYENSMQIDFSTLPEQFIIKCNHGAKFNIICHDKNTFDTKFALKKLQKWLKQDFSQNYAELHYRNISKRIICEKFLGEDLIDYKVYCFNGNPEFVMLCTNPSLGPVRYYLYTFEWYYMEFLKENTSDPEIDRPKFLDELYDLCVKLSSDFKFVRIDTYIHDDRLLFGEMTFTPSGFLDNSTSHQINKLFGDMLKL